MLKRRNFVTITRKVIRGNQLANLHRGGHIQAIDGLRAVAVVSIILFHLDAGWLPGGFVGVDIFFVISGFVVAYSVGSVKGMSLVSYFAWFYRRRLVRIYPVLLVFIVTTLLASTLLVPLADTSKFIELTGAAAVFGVSNILLMIKTGDYFATASEYNLFTHTWSLGVEEQYYLLFPFFSYFILVNRGRLAKFVLLGVATAAVISLVMCVYFTAKRPEFAFYMLPARFWELALGFLLYVLCFADGRAPRPLPAWVANPAIGWFAAVAMIASVIAADAISFPSPWALPPTLATAALILTAVKAPDHPVARLLCNPVASWIGKVSFSLYLWHWGVIVLMKWTIGMDTLPLKAVALGLTVMLSVASFNLIEDPARRAAWLKQLDMPRFYVAAGVLLSLIAGLGVGAYLYKPGLSLSATAQQAVWDPYAPFVGGVCGLDRTTRSMGAGGVTEYRPLSCEEGAGQIFVMGDSHAGAYNHAFERLAAEEGYQITTYSMGGCKLIDGFDPEPIEGCADFRAQALQAISQAATSGDTVMFAGHYTRRYRDAWHTSLLETSALTTPSTAQQTEELQDVEAMLAPLLQRGVRIVVEGPKPIARSALFRCADWFTRSSSYCSVDEEASRDDLLRRSAAALAFQQRLAAQTGLVLWQPFDVLCPPENDVCPTYRDGAPLYYDTDHLSAFGNDQLFDSLRVALSGT